jgi:glyoxylase-like metal-dependent hydrolase (beta-lactamase superfamily II)
MHEPEIESAALAIGDELQHAEDDLELTSILETHRDLLAGFDIANDKPVDGVDLFPLPGYTPGNCGLLLPTPKQTILICGDAIATREHLEQQVVLSNCANIELAQESFKECLEIADVVIPGRDNVVLNPTRI